MAVFAYDALTDDGTRTSGLVDATSAHAAWGALRDRGLRPTRLDTAPAASGVRRRARPEHRAVVLRQLAILLRGGVALADALGVVGASAAPALRASLARIAEAVREGASLADACAREGSLLDDSERAVVAAGEASGALAATLRDVAVDLDRRTARGRALRRALTYPAVLLVVAAVVLVATSVFVLPQVANLFAEGRDALPAPTRLLLATHALLARTWWLVVGLLGALAAVGWIWTRRPAGRRRLHEGVLRLPLVGGIVWEANVARFAHAAARMLRAGLPLDVALEGAAATVVNDVLRDDLLAVRRAIVEGRPLRAALAETRVASPALLGLVGTGEETGGLADALADVGVMHDESLDSRIHATFALLEPALLVTLAVVVLGLVWGVLVPFLTFDPLGAP